MYNPLSKAMRIVSAVTPTAGAAGTTNINGSIIDLTNFDGCLIAVHFGAIVAGAVTSIKAQVGNDSALADAADVSGSSITVQDTDDDKIFYIDVERSQKQYMRLVVSRSTQNATLAAVYLAYNSKLEPVTQPAGVSGAFVRP